MNNDQKVFEYNYSATEQAEIKKIREKYTLQEKKTESEIDLLRELDAGVTKKGLIAALTLGIISTLILGAGMSLVMTELGKNLNIEHAFVIGILMGVIGLIGVIMAFPLYKFIVKRERARIAPQIIKISDELLK